MNVESWYRDHQPAWRPRHPSAPHLASPENILGDEDGAADWHGAETATSRFVRTDNYDEMLRTKTLFLIGRRGTGKTTLLRMLDYEIKEGKVAGLKACWVCDSHSVILGMTTELAHSPLMALDAPQLADSLIPAWHWFLSCCAMLAITETSRATPGELVEVKSLRAYLRTVLGDYGAEPRTHLRSVLETRLRQALGDATSAGHAREKIYSVFRQSHDREASASLQTALRALPTLVMLDAGEVYQARKLETQATLTALIHSVYNIYTDRRDTGLSVKAAFPSEVWPHVLPYNRGKIEGRTSVIIWTYRELVALIAKRYLAILHVDADASIADRDLSTSKARDLVYRHIPAEITTRTGLSFDTLSYVIRHTQRTPRQVIVLLNSVLTFAKRRGENIADLSAAQEVIVEGIHARLEHLVYDVLDMQKYTYPAVIEIVRRMLSEKPSYFAAASLDEWVKAVSDLRREEELGRYDVTRVLTEAGVIGRIHEVNQKGSEHWLLESLFEYQVKDVLEIGHETICAVHPMFYGWLHTKIDRSGFVYPLALDEEERSALGWQRQRDVD